MKGFTWERAPFSACPACKKCNFGILRAGGDTLTKRCSSCRYSETITLPPVDKKVIYLDQFIFTSLFNAASGGRLPPGHESLTTELYGLLRRLVLLQQVILPHSDIHHDETTVFHNAMELREAYEFIGGDISLTDTRTVELDQVMTAAEAFLSGQPLVLDLSVDEVLSDKRNEWLSDMHISVRSDYSQFADGIRKLRDEAHSEFEDLAARWATKKPSFEEVLKIELDDIAAVKISALANTEKRKDTADADIFLDAFNTPIQKETRSLLTLMRRAGVPDSEAGGKVTEFWASDLFKQLPHHRIAAYLFAAIARRVVRGQKTIVNRGMMNDIRLISAYAPYLDAMFIDNTSAQLLREPPLTTDLEYRARIFSYSNGQEFLEYLRGIEANTPKEVSDFAKMIYGVD